MFCKACGSSNPENAEFCSKCGAPLETSESAPPPGRPPRVSPPVPPPTPPGGTAPPPMPTQYPAQGYGPLPGQYPPPPQSLMPQRPPGMSRGLLWGIIAAVVIVLGAGGGTAAYLLTRGDDGKALTFETPATTETAFTGTTATSSTTTTGTGDTTTPTTPSSETTANPSGARAGGTLAVFITEPDSIDPVNMWESQGTQIGNAVFDSLTAFNYVTGGLIPAAAESWEANADASVWTFHLVSGATFHDGSPVTAADFKYAWERICDPAGDSEISYHLSAVKGYDAMRDGTAGELSGVQTVDDNTLEVTLTYSFGDFEYVVGHPSLGPVPRAAVEADPVGFAEQPIGNGPFMMAEPWRHNQEINVVRYDGYYGRKAYLDGVDFKILANNDTAWQAFQAGDLDFTEIPAGELQRALSRYGESADGHLLHPSQQRGRPALQRGVPSSPLAGHRPSGHRRPRVRGRT
jgi:hypothetical protein